MSINHRVARIEERVNPQGCAHPFHARRAIETVERCVADDHEAAGECCPTCGARPLGVRRIIVLYPEGAAA